MSLLLCAATEMELQPTLQALKHSGLTDRVQFLCTGVGLLQATYHITRAIYRNRPDQIIQAGIAGSFHPDGRLGTVSIVQSETVGDLGVMERKAFRSLTELGFLNPDSAPWKNGWLVNESPLLQTLHFPLVKGVTVNEISTDEERIRYYHEDLQADCETMEGAALHYTALSEGIPFLQLRAYSNYAGERDKSRWELQHAITRLNDELLPLIKQILEV